MWNRDFFVAALSESYGKQRADNLFEELVKSANLPSQQEYNREEALEICQAMKSAPELFLQVLGGCLKIKLGIQKNANSPQK